MNECMDKFGDCKVADERGCYNKKASLMYKYKHLDIV